VLPAVRAKLGVVPDTEIARRVGVSPPTVALVRAELDIPRPAANSRAMNVVREGSRSATWTGSSRSTPDPSRRGICRGDRKNSPKLR